MRVALSSALICAVIATAAPAQVTQLPPHLRDRGRGVRTSVFGTYIEPRQWLVLSAVGFVRTTISNTIRWTGDTDRRSTSTPSPQ